MLPAIEAGAGAVWYGLAVIVGVAAFFWFKRRARQILVATGNIVSVWRPAATLFTLALLTAYLIAGVPFQLDMPELRGFNFRGGISVIRICRAIAGLEPLYGLVHCRDCARRH